MNYKLNRNGRAFKAKERREIETLIDAYRFARTHETWILSHYDEKSQELV